MEHIQHSKINQSRKSERSFWHEPFSLYLYKHYFSMAPTFLCNVGTCFVYFEAEGKLANKVTANNNVEKLRN